MLAPRSRATVLVFALLLSPHVVRAQAPPEPLSGIVTRESEHDPWSYAEHRTFKDAISADGRYVVFTRTSGNYLGDIFLRDRYTRQLRQINLRADGSAIYAPSYGGSISANGRHVIFVSCGQLTPDDVNGYCDLYARDLESNILSRISTGPAGEEPLSDAGFGSISNDGRFIAFTAQFSGEYGYPRRAWVRDRDADANGVFDEPGAVTTVLASVKADGSPAVSDFSIAINGGDARYVAFTSWDADVVPEYVSNGSRLYVRDLQLGTTVRVDVPIPGTVDEGWSGWADLSDDGSAVVYESSVRVTEDDSDFDYDVFLFNLQTGGNLALSTAAAGFERALVPSISGDGRYVAFAGQLAGEPSWAMAAWIHDRTTGLARQVTKPLPDWGSTPNVMEVALTQDGSELLFSADPIGLVYDYWPYGRSVFVVTTYALSPDEETVSASGGSFTAQVAVRDGVAWTASTLNGWMTLENASGAGPGTFTVSVMPNTTNDTRTGYVWLGSQQIVFRQPPAPKIDYVTPFDGPVTGGTTVAISGQGFEAGASVFFDGTPATNVVVSESRLIEAVTPPRARSGPVEVRVVNPDGLIALLSPGFWYRDQTLPEVEPVLEGPLGAEGFYVGDVTIRWTITEPESDVRTEGCDTRTFVEDGRYYAYCRAESEGGTTERWVEIGRDTAGPAIDIWSPWYSPYAQVPARLARGSQVQAGFACSDDVSGVARCEGDAPNSQWLDTSAVGSFVFTVRAEDRAGNRSLKQAPYVVIPATELSVGPASAEYGSSAMLTAALTADGGPVVGRTVQFWVGSTFAGSAVTSPNGVASLMLPLGTRATGTYFVWAQFDGDEQFFSSGNTGQLVVVKATPQLTWPTPSALEYPGTLGAAQLNATSSVPGAIVYSPSAGTVLAAGVHTLTATFTPADAVNYGSATATVSLTVTRPIAVLTWQQPPAITYGTVLSAAQLNASADVAGTFTYTPAAGTRLSAGTHTLTATFTPSDGNIEGATATVALTVLKAVPTLSWGQPQAVTYGAGLSAAQLNATASVAGSFAYSPTAGAVLQAGTHMLTVVFTPADTSNYEGASRFVSLAVMPAPLTVRANDAAKVFGEPLPAFTASGIGFVNGDTMASLAGGLSFSTNATQASAPGTYVIGPTGVSSPNYTIAFAAGSLTVSKAATAMTLAASPSPSGNNKPVRLTATVGVVAPGSGTPAGVVEFRDKGALLGTASIVNGVATLNVTFRKGTHQLTASWSGDANLLGTSAALTHQVN